MSAFLQTLDLSPMLELVLIDLAWKSTVLLLAAAIITFALRKKSAAMRHAVWHWTFVGLLLLPAIALTGPSWGPARFVEAEAMASQSNATHPAVNPNTPTRPIVAVHPQPETATEPFSGDESLVDVTGSVDVVSSEIAAAQPSQPGVADADDNQSREGTADGYVSGVEQSAAVPHWPSDEVASSATATATPSRTNWLLIAWSIGCAVVALQLLIGSWRVERLRRRSIQVEDSTWRRLLAQVARTFRMRAAVDLKSSPQVAGPMAGGIFKPFILLPGSHAAWPEDRSRSVLLHELAHIARRDVPKQWLAQLACAVYWVHPLAWFAAWRLRVERERACDDAVLSLGTRASDYSQHLLEVATAHRSSRWLAASAMTMARSSQLKDRIERILDPSRPRSAPSFAAVTVMALAIIAMAGAVATAGRVIVRDSQGNVVATIALPEGGSVSLEDDGAAVTEETESSETDAAVGVPLQHWGQVHSLINQEACAQCHSVDDWSQVLIQPNYCPTWPHGIAITDIDMDGILDLYLSQPYSLYNEAQPQTGGDSAEMYRRLMLDILGRPPTAEEMQSLLEREEQMRRELMQSVAEELMNQLQSQAPSDATNSQIESWRRWMDMVGEPTSDPEVVIQLWMDLLGDPPAEFEAQPSDDISAYDAFVREQLASEYELAVSDYFLLQSWINGDPHYPQSSGLLPASVEQPRGMWQIETVNPRGPIIGLELSANGRFLAMANSGVVRVYDFDALLSGHSSSAGVQHIFAGIPFYNNRAPLAWEPGADTADGGWLAAGACDGTVRLLKFDGTVGPTLQTENRIVVGVCWSPDGKYLAAAGYHGQITVWDKTWQRVHEFRSNAWLSSIDWKPDGTQILVSNLSHGLEIWTPDGTHVRRIETPSKKNEIARWSPDGTLIASTSSDPIGAIAIPSSNYLRDDVNYRPAYSIPIPEDNPLHGDMLPVVHSSGNGGKYWVWTSEGELEDEVTLGLSIHDLQWRENPIATRLCVLTEETMLYTRIGDDSPQYDTFPTDHGITAIAFRDDGALAFADAAGNVSFKRSGSTQLAKVTGTIGELTSVSCSPDSDLTAVAGEASDGTGFVALINTDGEIETHIRLPARVTGVTWSPDGRWFVPALDGEPTRIWKRDGTRLGDLGPGVYDFVSWQPASIELMGTVGNYIAAASGNERLVFTVTDRGEGIDPMTLDSTTEVTSLAWNPTGNLFVTGTADGVVSACNGVGASDVAPHTAPVELLAWSPDGVLLATACGPEIEDTNVLFWKLQDDNLSDTGIVLTGSAAVTAMAWSPDGKTLLVTRADNSFATYTTDGLLITSQMLFGVMAHDAEWDPQQDRFAVGTSSGAVEIVLPDGMIGFTLRGHTGRVTDIEWSPSGERLTAIAEDGTARCWDTMTGEPLWVYVPAGPDEAITLRPDGVLLSRLEGTPDSAYAFVGGEADKQEVHPAQFEPEEMIWDAIEIMQDEAQ